MISKEQTIEYLNRVTNAWKELVKPSAPVCGGWCAHVYDHSTGGGQLAIHGLDDLVEVLGYPKVRRHFSDGADCLALHWNGVDCYTLVYPARIGEKKEVTL